MCAHRQSSGRRSLQRCDDVSPLASRQNETPEGKQHPDRDAQFRYLNERARNHRDDGQQRGTKKKELAGNYARGGREWRPAGDRPASRPRLPRPGPGQGHPARRFSSTGTSKAARLFGFGPRAEHLVGPHCCCMRLWPAEGHHLCWPPRSDRQLPAVVAGVRRRRMFLVPRRGHASREKDSPPSSAALPARAAQHRRRLTSTPSPDDSSTRSSSRTPQPAGTHRCLRW
jgi:hypothetical protein